MSSNPLSRDERIVTGEKPYRPSANRRVILATLDERARIRTELIDWLVCRLDPKDAGLVNGRRIVDEIDRICPKE